MNQPLAKHCQNWNNEWRLCCLVVIYATTGISSETNFMHSFYGDEIINFFCHKLHWCEQKMILFGLMMYSSLGALQVFTFMSWCQPGKKLFWPSLNSFWKAWLKIFIWKRLSKESILDWEISTNVCISVCAILFKPLEHFVCRYIFTICWSSLSTFESRPGSKRASVFSHIIYIGCIPLKPI